MDYFKKKDFTPHESKHFRFREDTFKKVVGLQESKAVVTKLSPL